MSELYQTLLREEKKISYGATLQNIVSLGKGNKMNKQIIITVNGDEYEPITAGNFSIIWEDDTIKILIDTISSVNKEDTPSIDGFEDTDIPTSTYDLAGDDFDAFSSLSDFRLDENKTEKIEDQKPQAVSLESATYNIQDATSIQNATMDLMAKESEHIKNGYKVLTVSVPRYIYENKDNFKLIETAVLYNTTE